MASQAAEFALAPYVAGTRAWFPHRDLGWASATLASSPVVSSSGAVELRFVDDETGVERLLDTTVTKIAALAAGAAKESASLDAAATASGQLAEGQLPPLRNPPLLEATDDLTNLSHLNEPSGAHAPFAP